MYCLWLNQYFLCSLEKSLYLLCLIDLLIFGSAVKIRPREGDVYFDVIAVVDPVTRDAQKLAPLLLVGTMWSLSVLGDLSVCLPS